MIKNHKTETMLFHRQKIQHAMGYLSRNVSEPVPLLKLGEIAGVDPFHLNKLFVNYLGITPFEYHQYIRIGNAARLLREKEISITEICFAAGYETPSSFSKAFKKLLHFSPSQFRKLNGTAQTLKRFSHMLPFNRVAVSKPLIKALPEIPIFFVKKSGFHNGLYFEAGREGAAEICGFVNHYGLEKSTKTIIALFPEPPLGMDDPQNTVLIGGFHNGGVKASGNIKTDILPAGKWAIFQHQGPWEFLVQSIEQIYLNWLPFSNKQLTSTPPFIHHVNDSTNTATQEKLITNIYVQII